MDNKKQDEEEEEDKEDKFRDIFKYYKRRKPPPDFSRAIDVTSCSAEVELQPPPQPSKQDIAKAQEAGLTPPHTWTIHSFIKHPGLLLVRNPFTKAGQLVWASRCLRDMPRAPNRTNLASHGIHLQDRTWWQMCQTKEGTRSGLRQKLRWVTLGYHHDWDTKEYSEDMRGDMPQCVVELCGVVARVLGLCGSGSGDGGGGFKAQAAIINYYHHHSTLSPHTDHSEPYMDAPLLSFSFGQSAVFLIGGPTKATAPSAVMLHSGDIVIMGGGARLCYHAVPRILQKGEWRRNKRKNEEEMEEQGNEEEPWATEVNKEEKEKEELQKGERSRKNVEEMEDKEKEKEEEQWATVVNKEEKEEELQKTEWKNRRRNGEEEMEEEEKEKEEEEPRATEVNKEEKETENANNKHKNTKQEEKEEKNDNNKHKTTETDTATQDKTEEPAKKRKTEGNEGNENQKKTQHMTGMRQNDKMKRQMNQNSKGSKNDILTPGTHQKGGSGGGGGGYGDLPDILDYLRTCRINMNIRQVLPPSWTKLPS